MKISLAISCLILVTHLAFGQKESLGSIKNQSQKGTIYVYWGWNWEGYSKSDIKFTGENYNFTLNNVVAKDRQSHFSLNTYFSPNKITIPQYNFRLGYFITKKWDISIGVDHMKYVVQTGQTVNISGEIHDSQSIYDGTYVNSPIVIAEDFLRFEHTDGLNYLNVELRFNHFLIRKDNFGLSLIAGGGAGILLPKTNATLLSNERHDEFHLSGFGIGSVIGLNATFFNKIFIQTEAKGGYISMPDIRTTAFILDKAKQSFFFRQINVLMGVKFNIGTKAKPLPEETRQ